VPASCDQDVLWLDVAVQDASFVRGRDPISDLDEQFDDLLPGARRIRPLPERPAFNQLCHDVLAPVDGPNIQNSDKMRMIDRKGCLRFSLKAPSRDGIRELVGQQLDGDPAIESRVNRPVDLSHAARANQRQDFVSAEASTRCQGQAVSSEDWIVADGVPRDNPLL
jgi:hypothetical protein